jgi:hypothetical protein
VGLIAALIVIAVFWFLIPASVPSQSKVEWWSYSLPSGPNATNNFTLIPAYTYCPPSDATGEVLFSMTWAVVSGPDVQEVKLATTIPGTFEVKILYAASNASSGGTSFPIDPLLCEEDWVLEVSSATPAFTSFLTALSYNVTA